MGRTGRAKRHDAKMRAKRAAKAARKALYASLRGTSSKGKKMRAKTRTGATSHKHLHLTENCGNVGCGRCFPQFVRKILNGRVIETR